MACAILAKHKLLILLLCFGLIGCGGGGGGGGGQGNVLDRPQAPVTKLTLSKYEIHPFEEVRLIPTFGVGVASILATTHYTGETVRLGSLEEPISSGEQIVLHPIEDSTYVLTLEHGESTSSDSVSITITREVSIGDASSFEGDAGDSYMSFPVSLDFPALGNVDVYISTRELSARAELDFFDPVGVATIASGLLDTLVSVPILADRIPEAGEEFWVDLKTVTGNAIISQESRSALGEILNDDQASLNDTGILFAGYYTSGNTQCEEDFALKQDCAQGRDITHVSGSSLSGFEFVKLNATGFTLLDQGAPYESEPWSCVQDNTTGLIWEVKTTDIGFRDSRWTYTSFDPKYSEDDLQGGLGIGGADMVWAGPVDSGIGFSSDNCGDINFDCRSSEYLAKVNTELLCGYSDWRIPRREELRSILNYGSDISGLDLEFFPNNRDAAYLTGSVSASFPESIWVIDFSSPSPSDLIIRRSSEASLRLVRGGSWFSQDN